MAKRGPTLEDKYYGDEPWFTADSSMEDSDWQQAAHWYNYFYKNKDYLPTIYKFAETEMGYDKKKVSILKKVKDWEFMPIQKGVKIFSRGWLYKEEQLQRFKDHIDTVYKKGLEIKQEKAAAKKATPTITPAERTRRKVVDTIYADWDTEIVESWFEKDYTKKFGAYNRFKMHGLKSNAINIFKSMIEVEYYNIKEAYEKTCDQCVEAYAHIGKGDKRKIMKQFEDCFADLERLKDSFKAQRAPRALKPKSSDKQVEKLKFCKEDVDAKLVSINPVLIPGKRKLFVYNTKNKKLMEYTTSATSGFIVSGTSIKNFDETSRQATLRKPDVILPDILNRTEKQIEKLWGTITTKINKPTGRINSDCILLRAI